MNRAKPPPLQPREMGKLSTVFSNFGKGSVKVVNRERERENVCAREEEKDELFFI